VYAESNSAGRHTATFKVRAIAVPASGYDSAPDSACSLDNLAPATPTGFTGAYVSGATHLHWSANLEPDFAHYRIYRGSTPDFVPGPGNLIASPSDTGYADPGAAGSEYKLSAVDSNDNESGFAALGPDGTLSTGPPVVAALALLGTWPNPMTGDRALVRFSLPSADRAELELVDLGGRRVAGREVGTLGAGVHSITLSPAGRLPPGVYTVRLTQRGRQLARRVVVLR